jgi:hypothetical protein
MGKAKQLLDLAMRVIPEVEAEHEQGQHQGTTATVKSGEFAALVECVVSEIYSAVDCVRKVIAAIYGKYPGVTSDSTRKLFGNARDGKVDARVPSSIRSSLAEATWYDSLRRLRDGIAHGETGSCHFDRKTRVIDYFHVGLGDQSRALVIPNVVAVLLEYIASVKAFITSVFAELNRTLKNDRTMQLCGIFRGLVYSRQVAVGEATDFAGGVCSSYEWFEKEESKLCPLRLKCHAYARAHSGDHASGGG